MKSIPGYLIYFIGALVAVGPLSMDAYLPAIPAMVEYFDSDIVSLNNTLSVFLVGYAFGQFFGGAFSDQVGRKRIGYVGLSVYVLTTLAMTLTTTVDQLTALRFVQAIGGGFSTVICMALVRDIYPMEELGRRFATVTMIVLVAPLVAPTLGSLLLPIGWWFIFIFKALYALALLMMYVFLIGETRPGTWRDLSITALFVQCKEVVARRVDGSALPIRYAISMALSAAVLMTFVTNASIIYLQFFDLSPTVFPLVFGVSVVGFMSMNLFSMQRLTTGNAGKFFRAGLKIQIVGAAGLFLLVVLGFTSIWIIVPVLAVTVATLGLVGPAGSARYMSFFTGLAGSASSVYTTMMFSFGGVFGWLAGRFYDGSLLPIVSVMLAVSIAANLVALTIPNRTLVAPTVI